MYKTRYLLTLILLISGKFAFAQVPAWGGGADQTDYSFGFSFQSVTSYYKIWKKPNWQSPYFDPGVGHNITDAVTSITSPNAPGFAVGFGVLLSSLTVWAIVVAFAFIFTFSHWWSLFYVVHIRRDDMRVRFNIRARGGIVGYRTSP